jgi:hydrogenase maturation protein HypF
MKLEAAASEPVHAVPAAIRDGVLDTTGIVVRALELLEAGRDRGEIAASCQAALARGLAAMAVEVAGRTGARRIGLSGGVAYNAMIHRVIREAVLEAGFEFVTNTLVPCGDGGIALGQAAALAYKNGWIEPL